MPKHLIDPKTGKPIKATKAEAEKLAAQGFQYITKSDFKRLSATTESPQK